MSCAVHRLLPPSLAIVDSPVSNASLATGTSRSRALHYANSPKAYGVRPATGADGPLRPEDGRHVDHRRTKLMTARNTGSTSGHFRALAVHVRADTAGRATLDAQVHSLGGGDLRRHGCRGHESTVGDRRAMFASFAKAEQASGADSRVAISGDTRNHFYHTNR